MAVAYCNARITNNIVKNNSVSVNSSINISGAGGIWYSCITGFPDSIVIVGNIISENLGQAKLGANTEGTSGGGLNILGDFGQTVRGLIKNNTIENNGIYSISGRVRLGCGAALIGSNNIEFTI